MGSKVILLNCSWYMNVVRCSSTFPKARMNRDTIVVFFDFIMVRSEDCFRIVMCNPCDWTQSFGLLDPKKFGGWETYHLLYNVLAMFRDSKCTCQTLETMPKQTPRWL